MLVANLGKTESRESPSVWVLDPDPVAREVIERLLFGQGMAVLGFQDHRSFAEQYRAGFVHCLVVECTLLPDYGRSIQQQLAATGDLLPVIFVAERADVPTAVAAMKAGASDFLLKPIIPEALCSAVRSAVARAQRYRAVQDSLIVMRRLQALTEREREILELVVAGYSTKQISARLHRVDKTVEFHRQNIMRKLGASNVAHLVRLVTTADHVSRQRQGNGSKDRRFSALSVVDGRS